MAYTATLQPISRVLTDFSQAMPTSLTSLVAVSVRLHEMYIANNSGVNVTILVQDVVGTVLIPSTLLAPGGIISINSDKGISMSNGIQTQTSSAGVSMKGNYAIA